MMIPKHTQPRNAEFTSDPINRSEEDQADWIFKHAHQILIFNSHSAFRIAKCYLHDGERKRSELIKM